MKITKPVLQCRTIGGNPDWKTIATRRIAVGKTATGL